METEALLQQHGVKPTPQRVVIADYLLEARHHPTADEVFEAVGHRLPVKLSRATVYNTLNTLVEAGVALEMPLEPGRVRYEANREEHHHFVDVKTGAIVDIPWDQAPQLCKSLGDGFKVHNYQVTFYGERTAPESP